MATKGKTKSKTFRKDDSQEETQQLSQFEPHESDNSQSFWDVVCILRESGSKYQVEWAGKDPQTGQKWKPSWIPKEDCTDPLIQDWKARKRARQEAKKMAEQPKNKPPPPVAPSSASTHRPSRSVSHRSSEDTVTINKSPVPTRSLSPVAEKGRKRRRSPFVTEEVPPQTPSVEIESEKSPKEVERPQKKRRILDSSSEDTPGAPDTQRRRILDSSSEGTPGAPEIQHHEIPSPVHERNEGHNPFRLQDKSVSPNATDPPSSQVVNGSSPEQVLRRSRSRSPRIQIPSSSGPNLGPIPQISPTVFRERMEAPLSQIEQFSTPETSARDVRDMLSDASESKEAHPDSTMRNAYDLIVSPSRVHQLKPQRRESAWSSPRASSTTSSGHRKISEASRNLSREKRIKDLKAVVAKKDTVIESQQAMLASINGDRSQLQKKLETEIHDHALSKRGLEAKLESEVRDHALSKQRLEAQITALTESINRFNASSPAPESIQPPAPPAMDAVMAPPPVAQRSAEDDALITHLREEVAKLQDANSRQSAEIAHSNAMTEQARDVARRAEVARMELARKEKTAREIAQNAPKIVNELFTSRITKLEAEIEKYKTQNQLLLDQSRLTGDPIRKKAARYDGLLLKHNELSAKHEEMYEDLLLAENEKEIAVGFMRKVHAILQAQQGTTDTAVLLRMLEELNEETQEDQSSEDGEDNNDEMGGVEDEGDGDSLMVTEPDQAGPQPIVEERAQSYHPPDFRDAPTIFIEEIEEQPLAEAFTTPRSTQSEISDGLVYPCLWHQMDDENCQEYRSTKQSLRDHIFNDHLTHL